MSDDEHSLVITCGTVAGRLHTKLFKCPGIRVPCVEFQGGFITPKDFTYVGGKHTLKDWKTAIKCNGMSLRKLIDTGGLDFYNHEELCTGRCVSRNLNVASNFPRPPADATYISTATTHDADLTPLDSTNSSLDEQAYTVLKQMQDGESDVPEIDAVGTFVTNHSKLNSGGSLHKIMALGSVKKEPVDEEDMDMGLSEKTSATNGINTFFVSPASIVKKKSAMKSKYDVAAGQGDADFDNLAESFPNIDDFLDESQQFWSSILKVGLMEPVMKEIKKSLDQMWISWMGRGEVNAEEATRMSHAISDLGLTQVLKVKLAEQQTCMSRQNVKLQIEIDELKRKLAESEKKQVENNKKSEAFESLLELSNKVKSKGKPSESPKSYQLIYTDSPTVLQHTTSPKRKAEGSPVSASKRRRTVTPTKRDEDYMPNTGSDSSSE